MRYKVKQFTLSILKHVFNNHFCKSAILNFQKSDLVSYRLRRRILKVAGIETGHSTHVSSQNYFGSEWCRIGDHTYINRECFFAGGGGLTIGDNVHIAPRVSILTATHEIGSPERRGGNYIVKPVIISNGCWIGACAVILPGVTIAEGCIIGAGSIVIKSTSPHGIYTGNPAKRIKELPL